MNKRVLSSLIVLMGVFLLAFIAVKMFFGDWFAAVVQNEKILAIGNAIDNDKALHILADVLVGILIMHFYLCSCKQVWRLRSYQYLMVCAYSVGMVLCGEFLPSVAPVLDILAVIVAPFLLRCKIKQSIVIFVLHYAGQAAVLFLRSEPLFLVSTNYATTFILVFDMYIWLALYYLYSNLYKEETLWDCLLQRFSAILRKKSLRKNSRE